MFRKVLIANRGAIACRIIRTLKAMGIGSVAVFSDADGGSRHVAEADEAVRIGPPPAAESYLNIPAILAAAKETGAEAIHPGYGFLSESTEFAAACAEAGIVFIGPTPQNITDFGLKHTARDLAEAHGVALAPGTGLLTDPAAAVSAAQAIGYPVILKATAGGGGIGMKICHSPEELSDAFASVVRMGAGNFGNGGVFLERYVETARHIEVQVFGDGQGKVVALGERDCSLQRRNQKVVEETPAPLFPPATRAAMIDAAVRLTAGAHYRSAGTVEFLYDPARDDFYFLEVNTRLQVEHGVTEQVTGVDLVEWMVRGAAGDFAMLDGFTANPQGASIQVRLYAEDPAADFRPSSGLLTEVVFPPGPRVDGWVAAGSQVSAWYDPMLAKLIVTAPTRAEAIAALQHALAETRLSGIETNLDWLRTVIASDVFTSGKVSTRALATIPYAPQTIRVLAGGPATTVQDWPGRLGYWDVGVPPSGPMDALSFRLGNRLLGNLEGAAGLEFTAAGPTLKFDAATRLCLTGAEFAATLDGEPVPFWQPFAVAAGQTLQLGRVTGAGLRGYLLVEGGIAAPEFLGSAAAFTLGEFGGHAGRGVLTGDVLHLNTNVIPGSTRDRCRSLGTSSQGTLPASQHPPVPDQVRDDATWTLRVLYGPHGAPDFFTPEDIATLTTSSYTVHYNSSRTGVRLTGPKPHWARQDGGEAGLHPSNIHDNAYAVGAVDFTGDMPILLGPDGPSLGGFVCPFVTIAADLWKLGQLAPGDTVRFLPVSEEGAALALEEQDALVSGGSRRAFANAQSLLTTNGEGRSIPDPDRPEEALKPQAEDLSRRAQRTTEPHLGSPIVHHIAAQGHRPEVTYRRQGDQHLLVEYGPIVLDLELRLRIHALMQELEAMALPGIIDVTPGIRSVQVHHDSRLLPQRRLVAALAEAEDRLGSLDDFAIPSRTVWLPLSWNDPAIHETVAKYIASVRDDAPWCPDNIEFIRRANGLASVDEVRRIVFDAEYLVMGLGDVYLGAPVATPVDPRHRLVTTKYNPARTWTAPNVVGIGGAYMCIYGMEGPGGYQLFGRTIQVWNSWQQTGSFRDDKPWLLRFFDRIRFFPVSHEELTEWRRDFSLGRREVRIDEGTFRLADYRAMLADNAASIAAFQQTREAAFAAERAEWQARGEFDRVAALTEEAQAAPAAAEIAVPDGCEVIEAPFGGVLWSWAVADGDRVEAGQTIAVIEAMKMESPVLAPCAGRVRAVYVTERQPVTPGAPLLALEPA